MNEETNFLWNTERARMKRNAVE